MVKEPVIQSAELRTLPLSARLRANREIALKNKRFESVAATTRRLMTKRLNAEGDLKILFDRLPRLKEDPTKFELDEQVLDLVILARDFELSDKLYALFKCSADHERFDSFFKSVVKKSIFTTKDIRVLVKKIIKTGRLSEVMADVLNTLKLRKYKTDNLNESELRKRRLVEFLYETYNYVPEFFADPKTIEILNDLNLG